MEECGKKETFKKVAVVLWFLQQAWFIEMEEWEYIKTVQGLKGGPAAAVSPYLSFHPSSDVAPLHKALTVKDVDEATIIDILRETIHSINRSK